MMSIVENTSPSRDRKETDIKYKYYHYNSNSNNDMNNDNKKSSKKPQTLEEMDNFFDTVSNGIDKAMADGFEECALCKTIGEKEKLCLTCGKARTRYAADVVLTSEEIWKGVNRIREWANKREKEEKK